MPRRAKSLWAVVWSNPANAPLLKQTDHGILARWCVVTYLAERDMKQPPPTTIEETRERTDSQGNTETVTKTRRNPAYDQMLATMRELRAIEDKLGFSPAARLNVDAKLGRPAPKGGAADIGRDKPDKGPLGSMRKDRPQPPAADPNSNTSGPQPPTLQAAPRTRPN